MKIDPSVTILRKKRTIYKIKVVQMRFPQVFTLTAALGSTLVLTHIDGKNVFPTQHYL